MLLLLLVFLTTVAINNGICSGNSDVLCIKSERASLLKFKEDVMDLSNRLASWAAGEGEDCCKWAGVVCNNITGHVQELHLRNPYDANSYTTSNSEIEAYDKAKLVGKINPSLFNLTHLSYLDLGQNNLAGLIPSQLGNLTALQYLSFGGSDHESPLYVENLGWLSGLSLLRHLDLSDVNLVRTSDHWLQVINMLPSLVELHLSNCVIGNFPSLPSVNFTKLDVLDLSLNNFQSSIDLPNWLCSLSGLTSLNFRGSFQYATFPSCFQSMTGFQYLDLSFIYFSPIIPDWLYSFSHLEHLNLAFCSLRGSISSSIGNLTSIITLNLFGNSLEGTLPESFGNLTSAVRLDFSFNELEGKMPISFGDLCRLRELLMTGVPIGGDLLEVLDILSRCILDGLEVLHLGQSQQSGHFPDVMEKLAPANKLEILYLDGNSLYGFIPESIAKLSTIRILDLSKNKLTGALPKSFGQLASLEIVDMSWNSLKGEVFEDHFSNLTKLITFRANGNQLTFRMSSSWAPSFQIRQLSLRSCQLGPRFPTWLRSQKQLSFLDISQTRISDIMPSWFWNLSSHFQYLNVSHNHIQGEVANVQVVAYGGNAMVFDLGSNHFNGSLPHLSSNVTELYFNDNTFSGSLSFFLCHRMQNVKNLRILDLDGNLLTGELPDCWMNFPHLEFLHLGNNNLSGHLPSSLGLLGLLESLSLRNNNLSGELPMSLQNCAELQAIDLGENQFSGNIPAWIGARFSKLKILLIYSNKFSGHIPIELCRVTSLQIIAFAHNNLNGTIPRCFNNMSSMVSKQNLDGITTYNAYAGLGVTLDNVILVTKGREAEYSTILHLVTLLDLSDNNLSGEIPKELTDLVGLRYLNLSRNLLSEKIPWEIGSMTSLETLDFSTNQLSGDIPPSMSSLTFLSHLNLSYNNLIGKIPSSTQLRSFDSYSFIGNKLCGPPLSEDCPVNGVMPNVENGDQGKGSDGPEVKWFYVSMVFGFVVGFWGLFGPILFNKWWRFAYFQLLDRLWLKFYGMIRKCFYMTL